MLSIILILDLADVFQAVGYTQEKDRNKTQYIDEFIQACYEYRLFTGTALIAENGKVIYKKAFGPANRKKNIPNDVNTQFKVGSITKQFTAMLVLQLAQEGKLKLDATIDHYLADYPQPQGSRIKIHHLLCHSPGIPNLARYYPDWFSKRWTKDYTTEEFIRLFSDLELEFEPGSRFSYSNAGYYLLAVIIEKITGKTYGKALKEKIFDPLGMKSSGHKEAHSLIPRLATGYEYWNFRFGNTGYNSDTIHKGNGGIYSTVEDLFKWDQALSAGKLLNKKYAELMFQPHMPLRGVDSYAYGWVVGEKSVSGLNRGIKFALHYGSDLGFNNVNSRLLDDDHAIILLSNMSQAKLPFMHDELLKILYGQPYFVPKPVSLALEECQNLDEIKTIIKDFLSARSQYFITRDAVNGLGFQFMQKKKFDLGLAVLEFNAKEFPSQPWVYESLGEAYLIAGNKKKAIENLKRLQVMDPRNAYAKKKLRELGALK